MKSPVSEPLESKRQRVDDTIQALALESCRSTPIGSPMHRGISGGQAKRANIGLALVTSPKVLFLDEPTSGLVSTACSTTWLLHRALLLRVGSKRSGSGDWDVHCVPAFTLMPTLSCPYMG